MKYLNKLTSIFLFSTILIFANNHSFAQSIKIINPAGGEIYKAGSHQVISWIYNDIKKINISYSSDDGKTWVQLYENINPSLGMTYWKTPSIFNRELKIKIEGAKEGISTISDKFSISEKKIFTKR